eukprot:SAG31_NODE_902_length_11133_cov_4.169386_9_plen_378_part_00
MSSGFLESSEEGATADTVELERATRWLNTDLWHEQKYYCYWKEAPRPKCKPVIPAGCEDPLALLAGFAGGWGQLLAGRYAKVRSAKVADTPPWTCITEEAHDFWEGGRTDELWLLWDIINDEGDLVWSGFFPIAIEKGLVTQELDTEHGETQADIAAMLGLAGGSHKLDGELMGVFSPQAKFGGTKNPYDDGYCPECCFQISIPLPEFGGSTWKQHVSLIGPCGLTETHLSTIELDMKEISRYVVGHRRRDEFDEFDCSRSVAMNDEGPVPGVTQITVSCADGSHEEGCLGCPDRYPDNCPFFDGLGETIYPCRAEWRLTAFLDNRKANKPPKRRKCRPPSWPKISVVAQFLVHDCAWRQICRAMGKLLCKLPIAEP